MLATDIIPSKHSGSIKFEAERLGKKVGLRPDG